MKFFRALNSENVIATLRTVIIGRSELTFFLILYFHGNKNNNITTTMFGTVFSPINTLSLLNALPNINLFYINAPLI